MSIQPMVNTAVKASIATRIGNGEGFKKAGLRPQQRNVRSTAPIRGGGARRGRGGGRPVQRTPRYSLLAFHNLSVYSF